jgi:hypothetical protein
MISETRRARRPEGRSDRQGSDRRCSEPGTRIARLSYADGDMNDDYEELYGERYGVVHRNGSVSVALPVRSPSAAGQRFSVPLWRAVLRYWCGALIFALFAWWNALGRAGHIGGAGAEPHAWLIPVVTVCGGLVAVLIARRSRLVVNDRRVLFSVWSACGVLAALVAPALFAREAFTDRTVAGGAAIFVAFLITVFALVRARSSRLGV